MQMMVFRLRLKVWTKIATSSLRNSTRQTGDHQSRKTSTNSRGWLPATPGDIGWPPKTDNIFDDFASQTIQKTDRLKIMQIFEVASWTLPTKKQPIQNSGTATEKFRETQTGKVLLPLLTAPRIVKANPKKQITTQQLL